MACLRVSQESRLKVEASHLDSLINILKRQLKFEEKIDDPTDTDKAEITSLQETITKYEKEKLDIETKLNSISSIQRAKCNELIVPPDNKDGILIDLDYKNLFYVIGRIGPNNKHDMINFFKKLFSFGTEKHFSHANYKQACLSLMEGFLLTELFDIYNTPFENIVNHFSKIYGITETLSDLEEKIKNFTRKPNESIESCLLRYCHLASKCHKHYPIELQTLLNQQNKIRVLLKNANPETAIELRKLQHVAIENGEFISFENLLEQAKTLEIINSHIVSPIAQENHFDPQNSAKTRKQQRVEYYQNVLLPLRSRRFT